jgi:hypothetical protein
LGQDIRRNVSGVHIGERNRFNRIVLTTRKRRDVLQ